MTFEVRNEVKNEIVQVVLRIVRHNILSVSISDLKRNPQAIIDDAQGEAIALLNRNKPTAYIIPAKTYEMLIEMAEDMNWPESSSSARAKKSTPSR